jgi:hypothetical protein
VVTPVSAAAAPGVYRQDIVLQPAPALVTGCPIILGYASGGPVLEPTFVTSAADFAARFVAGPGDGYLAETVDSFFVNGGVRAWIVRLENLGPNLSALQAITTGLQAAAQLDADLVCAPDIVRQRGLGETASPLAPDKEEVALMQQAVVADCERLATRVAILDALPAAVLTSTGVALGSSGSPIDAALVWQRDLLGGSPDAALYHPWISTGGGATGRFVPPCGAVAGIIARSDQQSGVHKAPANEPVLGCVDLEDGVDAARQGPLNQAGINCIRAFPGRGIRVWGARTVSKSAWPYLNVRRVVLTTARWAARALHDVAFEPSAPEVWARVTRLVASYLQSLYQQGALIGATPGEAFSVACDATTNTPELRALGRLAVSVTLNAGPPSEIVLLRLVRDETGVTIQSSSSPG